MKKERNNSLIVGIVTTLLLVTGGAILSTQPELLGNIFITGANLSEVYNSATLLYNDCNASNSEIFECHYLFSINWTGKEITLRDGIDIIPSFEYLNGTIIANPPLTFHWELQNIVQTGIDENGSAVYGLVSNNHTIYPGLNYIHGWTTDFNTSVIKLVDWQTHIPNITVYKGGKVVGIADFNTHDLGWALWGNSTGGTISQVTQDGKVYTVHTFTANGTFTPNGTGTVEVLVVGGGGGGSSGGGGGGAVLFNNSYPVTNGVPITVVVGNGGNGANPDPGYQNAGNGSNSSFGSMVAIGGAGGSMNGLNGQNGASGSGGSFSGGGTTYGGTNLSFYGRPGGGNGGYKGSPYPSGGGGGCNGTGGTATSNSVAGNGGAGCQYNLTGTVTYYGAGGGGGLYSVGGTAGTGGSGVGGNGFSGGGIAASGAANRGSGGGGTGFNGNGGSGGSGIVIVRYTIEDVYSLSITDPLSGTNKNTIPGSNLSVNFTYSKNGVNITSDVVLLNVTIGGLDCPLAVASTPSTCTGSENVCSIYGASQTNCQNAGCTYNTGVQTNTGLVYPTSNSVLTTGWTNPTYAYNNDGAQFAVAGAAISSNYSGFSLNVPAGATVDGIVVGGWAKASSNTGTNSMKVRVRNGDSGAWSNEVDSGDIQSGGASFSFGSASDKWGFTWTTTQANQIQINVTSGATSTRTMSLDYIYVTVYYTPAATCTGTPTTCANLASNQAQCTASGCTYTSSTPGSFGYYGDGAWQVNCTVDASCSGSADVVVYANYTVNSSVLGDTSTGGFVCSSGPLLNCVYGSGITKVSYTVPKYGSFPMTVNALGTTSEVPLFVCTNSGTSSGTLKLKVNDTQLNTQDKCGTTSSPTTVMGTTNTDITTINAGNSANIWCTRYYSDVPTEKKSIGYEFSIA